MDHSGQHPDHWCAAPSHGAAPRDERPAPRARLQLVSGTLVLSQNAEPAPAEWQEPFAKLIAAHRIDLRFETPGRIAGFSQMRRWAAGEAGASPAPVFAPWQCFSPVAFQPSADRTALPRAQFAASYLFAAGMDRPAGRRHVDIMVMSPHPASCPPDEDCGAALPRTAVLSAMIRAARAEGRSACAIIAPARSCSALARRLLGTDRALTRGEFAFEIVAIEDAIGRMIGGAPGWDAVIALPELRSIVLAALAETCGVAGPWPLLWHDRGLRMVASEALGQVPSRLGLDATVLIQSLALAARAAGLGYEAQRLYESWAQLRERGVVTASRGSALPYVTTVGESEFLALALTEPSVQTRCVPSWKAIAPVAGNRSAGSPVGLSLVASR